MAFHAEEYTTYPRLAMHANVVKQNFIFKKKVANQRIVTTNTYLSHFNIDIVVHIAWLADRYHERVQYDICSKDIYFSEFILYIDI